jgi:hypothetical protein
MRTVHLNYVYVFVLYLVPVTVAVRSKERNVFSCFNTGIVGSNPT